MKENVDLIRGIEYYIHPRFRNYGCTKLGIVYNVYSLKRPKQSKDENGYIFLNIPGPTRVRNRIMRSRFNCECFHYQGIIDEVVMHFDGNKTNDSIINLFIMS